MKKDDELRPNATLDDITNIDYRFVIEKTNLLNEKQLLKQRLEHIE